MRAHRLLPHSPDIALKLGLYWLTRDRAQARLWFERAAETAESREIWLGLALLRAGAAREAAIAHLLTRFAPPADNPAFAALAAEHPELRPSAARLAEVEGCVWEEENGDIAGWAWQPAAPDTQSVVTLCDTDGHRRSLFADADMRPLRPLTQPRGFSLPAASLRGWADEIHIIDPSGRDLPGSPIFRGVWRKPPPAGERVARPIAAAPARKVAVVVPVYRNRSLTRACLATLRASAPDAPVFVVDDATPEPALARDLDRMAQRGQIVLIRHSRNRGFPDSANAGLRAALALKEPHDVVLLNADVVLPRGQRNSWLNRLRASVHAQDDIASATPFSNAGGPLSYPQRDGDNPAFHLAQLDRLAARVNAGQSADIPTGVGFCLYLRNEALHAVGLLRENVFAQGYGEENDWCRRAAAFGWRHVGAGDVVVQHHEAQSFGAAKAALMARNTQMMARLHPGYLALVRDWAGTAPPEDTLATLRRNLDLARLRQLPHKPTTLLVSHCAGGGVERAVQTRVAEIAAEGGRSIILRPLADPRSEDGDTIAGWCVLHVEGDFPNLAFRLPREADALRHVLRSLRAEALEIHHRLGHAPELFPLLARLRLPTTHALHDYACVCPRITFLGPDNIYCGEPVDEAACTDCLARVGTRDPAETDVIALRHRSAQDFAAAAGVIVPSHDMARRLRRYFPALQPLVQQPEDDARHRILFPHNALTERVAVVIGALNSDKGFHILHDCAADAAARALPLRFRLVGMSLDDAALIATGKVFVTGRYHEAEAVDLLREQGGHLTFLPSVIPESWSFALSLAWRAGLPAVAFDIGAMAARIRRAGHGHLLPLGLPPTRINDFLLTCGLP